MIRIAPWMLAAAMLPASAILSTAAGAASPAAAGSVLRDCPDCPAMVVVAGGRYDMGAADGEAVTARMGSGAIEQGANQVRVLASEAKPRHGVTLARSFAIGQREVTYAQYAQFIRESGYQPVGADCLIVDVGSDDNLLQQDKFALYQGVRNTNWRTPPSWLAGPDYPVSCVAWDDTRAYAAWLSAKTHQRYRLPTEAEWEYAARGGTRTAWYWGDDAARACAYENVADETFLKRRMRSATPDNHFPCDDGRGYNTAVASYQPNPFGLHDMLGNVSEFVEDCWHETYQGAPADGSAWTKGGDCRFRVLRGNSGMVSLALTHAAARSGVPQEQYRAQNTGFRLVREVAP